MIYIDSQILKFPTPRNLDRDVELNAKRWRVWTEHEAPERERLPGEWKTRTDVQQICIMRALRPDRMTHAVQSVALANILIYSQIFVLVLGRLKSK